MILFVDSAAHIALLDAADQHHASAAALLRSIEASRFLTSTLVLSEVATRGAALVGARPVATYVRGIYARPSYRVVDVGREIFGEGLDLMVKYEDQGLSLTDSTNLVIMRAARIQTIFTFDRAFRRLGFDVVP